MTLRWRDAEDIGIALSEKFPDVDPLTVIVVLPSAAANLARE